VEEHVSSGEAILNQELEVASEAAKEEAASGKVGVAPFVENVVGGRRDGSVKEDGGIDTPPLLHNNSFGFLTPFKVVPGVGKDGKAVLADALIVRHLETSGRR